MGQSKPFSNSLDPQQIELLSRAIERAWDVIQHDEQGPEADTRELLAICIMRIVLSGEENFVKLVNRSIVDFRERRDQFRYSRAQLGNAGAHLTPSEGKSGQPD